MNRVPGTGDKNPATCPLHPDAIRVTAAQAEFLLPGADANNLWSIPYRGDRYAPSSWIGNRARAIGFMIPVHNEGLLGRHDGPFTPKNGGDFSQNEFMPQLTLRYRPHDDHSLFFRYAESFKAGEQQVTGLETPIFNAFLLSLNAKGYISDGFLTDTSGFDPVISMDEHEDLNLTVGIGPQNAPWEVAIYGRNLLEPKVTYHPEDDVQDDGIVSQHLSRNNFATYGVKFRYNFE